jgi:hypothetical protein
MTEVVWVPSKRTITIALFVLLAAASVCAFDPSELNRITFTNSTGQRIVSIVLSPSDSTSSGPDVLGADSYLKDGDSFGCYVHYPPSSFTFDILASNEGGQALRIHNFRMTDKSEGSVTFTPDDIVSAAPGLSSVTLAVQNATDHDLQYLFLSPSDSKALGGELLNDQALPAGETHSIVVPVGKQAVVYTLMCADDTNNQYVCDLTIDPSQGDTRTVSIGPDDLRPAAEK